MNIGIIPLISTIVSFVFAVTVLDQYFARRQPFQFLWTIGLFMYGISAFTEFYTKPMDCMSLCSGFGISSGNLCRSFSRSGYGIPSTAAPHRQYFGGNHCCAFDLRCRQIVQCQY